ncbi:MAG: riboflavin synthase [Candidatus Muiribacteriota bacterium]
MFTGLIETKAVVASISRNNKNYQLGLKEKDILKESSEGASISVNGVCLTLTEKKKNLFLFDIMPLSWNNTTLKFLKKGQKVNIERAMKANDRFDGHIVTGHIDTYSKINKITESNNEYLLSIELAPRNKYNIIQKGSVALDGISLTVAFVKNNEFVAGIIPETLKRTNLKEKKRGSYVNIEFDVLIKQRGNKKETITEDFLNKTGYNRGSL